MFYYLKMKFFINNDNNNIMSDSDKSNLQCFTEYKMNYDNIQLFTLNEKIKNSGKTYSYLLLMPMTHINNIWHLMHHIFITYK